MVRTSDTQVCDGVVVIISIVVVVRTPIISGHCDIACSVAAWRRGHHGLDQAVRGVHVNFETGGVYGLIQVAIAHPEGVGGLDHGVEVKDFDTSSVNGIGVRDVINRWLGQRISGKQVSISTRWGVVIN